MKSAINPVFTNAPEQFSEMALDTFICDNYKTMHDLLQTYVQYLTEIGQRDPSEQLFDPSCSSLKELMDELGITQKIRAVMRELMADEENQCQMSNQSKLFN